MQNSLDFGANFFLSFLNFCDFFVIIIFMRVFILFLEMQKCDDLKTFLGAFLVEFYDYLTWKTAIAKAIMIKMNEKSFISIFVVV